MHTTGENLMVWVSTMFQVARQKLSQRVKSESIEETSEWWIHSGHCWRTWEM